MSMNLIDYDFAALIDSLFKRENGELVQRTLSPMRHARSGARYRHETNAVIPTIGFINHYQSTMRNVLAAVMQVGIGRGALGFLPDATLMEEKAELFKELELQRLVYNGVDANGYEYYDRHFCEIIRVQKSDGLEMFYRRRAYVWAPEAMAMLYTYMRRTLDWVYDRVHSIGTVEGALDRERRQALRLREVQQLYGFLNGLQSVETPGRGTPGFSSETLRMNIKIAENIVELNKKRSMEDFVLDYEGNEIPSNEALVLTSQSDFEGEYIHSADARVHDNVRVWSGTSTVILAPEDRGSIIELVGGELVWEPDFLDDIRYIDAGTNDGEWDWVDDVIYCESDGCYYHRDDEGTYVFWDDRREEYLDHEPSNQRTHEYHSGFRKVLYSDDTKFTIGFEVEKEDEDILDRYDLDEADETKWCREADGSLGDDGYELVSPVYDLFTDDIDVALSGKDSVSRRLVSHINADYTSNCGGHINIGQIGMSGENFFDSIQAFVPLFLSIWRYRLGNSYSQMHRKPSDYKRASKYSAVHVKDRYIELRLPPAVRNVTQLLWRRDLIRIVCENQNVKPLNVISMMLNPKSKLHVLLRKVYSVEMIHKIVSLYAQFADDLYSSYDFTSDGVGVFVKSAVRRLKNRKVKGTIIVSNTFEATTRLSNTFGAAYDMDNEKTKNYLRKVEISE